MYDKMSESCATETLHQPEFGVGVTTHAQDFRSTIETL